MCKAILSVRYVLTVELTSVKGPGEQSLMANGLFVFVSLFRNRSVHLIFSTNVFTFLPSTNLFPLSYIYIAERSYWWYYWRFWSNTEFEGEL